MTQTSYSYPYGTALSQAAFAVTQGQLSQAIVIQAETYSSLLEEAKNTMAWPAGAVAWLIGPCGVEIQDIQVAETPCSPEARLRYTLTSSTGKTLNHPLAMALELSHLYTAGQLPRAYSVKSDFGKLHIQFGQQS